MAWAYPHEFHDGTGETASGVQVNDNFTKAREKVEALEAVNAARPTAYSFLEPKTGRALNTSYTPSASKAVTVYLSVKAGPGADAICQIYVDGTPLTDSSGVYLDSEKLQLLKFTVKAGGTWQCAAVAGPMNLCTSTYQVLP